jgi:hypothetical protein
MKGIKGMKGMKGIKGMKGTKGKGNVKKVFSWCYARLGASHPVPFPCEATSPCSYGKGRGCFFPCEATFPFPVGNRVLFSKHQGCFFPSCAKQPRALKKARVAKQEKGKKQPFI